MKNVLSLILLGCLIVACAEDKTIPDSTNRNGAGSGGKGGPQQTTAQAGGFEVELTWQLLDSRAAFETGSKRFDENIAFLPGYCAQFAIIETQPGKPYWVIDFSNKPCPGNGQLINAEDLVATVDYSRISHDSDGSLRYELILDDAAVVGTFVYNSSDGGTIENLCNLEFKAACDATFGGSTLKQIGY